MKEFPAFGGLRLNAQKLGKLLRKNMQKPHFRERGGRKVTNRPRAMGLPVNGLRVDIRRKRSFNCKLHRPKVLGVDFQRKGSPGQRNGDSGADRRAEAELGRDIQCKFS
jgi:hypothetical protein